MARVAQFGRHPNHLPTVIRRKNPSPEFDSPEKGTKISKYNLLHAAWSSREANGRVTIKKITAFHKTRRFVAYTLLPSCWLTIYLYTTLYLRTGLLRPFPNYMYDYYYYYYYYHRHHHVPQKYCTMSLTMFLVLQNRRYRNAQSL